MTHAETGLILFIRYPQPGKVKSRLAATLGTRKAAHVYRLCCEIIFSELEGLPESVEKYLFYSDPEDREQVINWVGNKFLTAPQVGGDIGRRMADAFSKVFQQGAAKSILIGADLPDLSAAVVEEAIAALDESDIVLGPSHDGGYYLLGMKRIHEDLFKDIPWGTEQVLERTREKVRNLALSCSLLPVLRDIDTGEDLRQWVAEYRSQKHNLLYDFIIRNPL